MYDCSNTYDNIFFLRFFPTDLGYVDCGGASDTFGTDMIDESYVLTNTFANATFGGPSDSVDVGLKLGLSPKDNTPKPSDINLKIDGSPVIDDLSNENFGVWTNYSAYSSLTGILSFDLSADWWKVSCNITSTQINYTKLDMKATSDFQIPQLAHSSQ